MNPELLAHLQSSIGAKVQRVEVIAISQILRVYLDSGFAVELAGGWKFEKNSKIQFGAMDIGFYFDPDEDLLKEIEQQERRFHARISELEGEKLEGVKSSEQDLTLKFNGSCEITWVCLSAQELGLRLIRDA